jgi:DNA-binding NtrC family response regulator
MFKGRNVVLVEDDKIMGESLLQRLTLEGAGVQWHRLVARALPAIRTPRHRIDAVICDIRLPDGTGEKLFEALTQSGHPPPFLFITGQGSIDQAVRLIRSGAADYIAKPFEMAIFLNRLALVIRSVDDTAVRIEIGVSDLARVAEHQASRAAERDDPLMITGPYGVGKARLAQAIHARSDRCAAPFMVVDTHRQPADAVALLNHIGQVGEGSLVIIGVDQLAPEAQSALVEQLNRPAFRLMATMSAHLGPIGGTQRLRGDLLAMLQAHQIVLPPLAERPEDAVWLAGRLFRAFNARRSTPLVGIAAMAEEAIRSYAWPGNGRELRARVLRAVEAATGDMVLTSDLFPETVQEKNIRPLTEVRDAAERAEILAALTRTGGQIGEAAHLLKVSRTTLWEKMQKLGL